MSLLKTKAATKLVPIPDPPTEDDLNLQWGTFGKNGDEPMRIVRLGDCSTEHLQAILRTEGHIYLYATLQHYVFAIHRILRSRGVIPEINVHQKWLRPTGIPWITQR